MIHIWVDFENIKLILYIILTRYQSFSKKHNSQNNSGPVFKSCQRFPVKLKSKDRAGLVHVLMRSPLITKLNLLTEGISVFRMVLNNPWCRSLGQVDQFLQQQNTSTKGQTHLHGMVFLLSSDPLHDLWVQKFIFTLTGEMQLFLPCLGRFACYTMNIIPNICHHISLGIWGVLNSFSSRCCCNHFWYNETISSLFFFLETAPLSLPCFLHRFNTCIGVIYTIYTYIAAKANLVFPKA